ncbi:hypothetical protein C8R43DRAFT_502870 [Mycena crocata]|nr:hypothetical protein C8R43DRAFT_502870 [Mycena crocata]
MPTVPPQSGSASPSTGITIGVTVGGIVFISLLVSFVFLRRRRDQRRQDQSRRRGIVFDSNASAELPGRWGEKQANFSTDSSRSNSPPDDSGPTNSQTPLLTPSDVDASTSARPSIPRLTIPPSPPILSSSAFQQDPGTALSSACMDSSDSAYSQFSASMRSAGSLARRTSFHPCAAHFPSPASAAAYPQVQTSVVAASRPLITAGAHTRRSMHPIPGSQGHLVAGTDRAVHMDVIMEFPSPFIFTANPGEPEQNQQSPLSQRPGLESPLSQRSRLDSLIDAMPLPPTSLPPHVLPLRIKKQKPELELYEFADGR